MRLTRTGWSALAVLLICGVLLAYVCFQREATEHKVADGSVLRLQTVFYGKGDHYQPTLTERVKAFVRKAWAQWVSKKGISNSSGTWYMNTTIHTNNDALFVYFNRIDAATGRYQDVALGKAEILDEHGCAFLCTQSGGEEDSSMPVTLVRGGGSGYAIEWFRFEAFPRHQRKFRLRVFDDSDKMLGEFVVNNPAPAPQQANWPVEKFPITKTYGNVAFTLKGIKIKHPEGEMAFSQSYDKIAPEYEVTEDGQPSKNWQALDMSLFDSSGNFASEMREGERILCPHEDAWKLRVKFFGSEQTRYASNTTWTLRGLKVPDAGTVTPVGKSQKFAGILAKAILFAGPGEYSITNSIVLKAAPLGEEIKTSSATSTYKMRGYQAFDIKAKTLFLYANLGDDLPDDQRLTVRATDEQGRDYYAHDLHLWSDNSQTQGKPSDVHYMRRRFCQQESFLSFDLPADVKTVDITFCVHTCQIAEFTFKPPTEIAHASTNAAK